MIKILIPPARRTKVVLALLLLSSGLTLKGQDEIYNYFYRVYFKDKGSEKPADYSPSDLLSERAVNRRMKAGIPVPDYRDIPVFKGYLSQIKVLGYTLHCTSKWLNTALIKTAVETDPGVLLSLPFVEDVKIVKRPAGKSMFVDKLDFKTTQSDIPPYDRPITMLNGDRIQYSGFTGKGVLIAVLDGGFINADKITSLTNLRSRGGIECTYDFVSKNPFVYGFHSHGTAVLSVLSGQIYGVIQGTAPDADYMLIRTEDTSGEYSAEEDFWAAGAEFADSTGADIISSSLGYYKFDDTTTDYKFSDMDGNTTFVTRAADIAASRGIVVVTSVGNERDKEWVRIIAPSDGDSVISAGAVDGNKMISSFSSAGPSADGRIKPDNSAMGVSVTVQTSVSDVARSNGTSFSCPVLSGMAACLLQAVPDAKNTDIIYALHSSADRFNIPDSLYGYGIPDMVKALTSLQKAHLIIPENKVIIRPNPTKGEFEIVFREEPGNLTVDIFSSTGVAVFRKYFMNYAGRSLIISALSNREQGLYLLRMTTDSGIFTRKIVKLRE
jgi:serine protease AprX